MSRTITIDAGLETDIRAYREAREKRQNTPTGTSAAVWKQAYERECDAALDLARALVSRVEGM